MTACKPEIPIGEEEVMEHMLLRLNYGHSSDELHYVKIAKDIRDTLANDLDTSVLHITPKRYYEKDVSLSNITATTGAKWIVAYNNSPATALFYMTPTNKNKIRPVEIPFITRPMASIQGFEFQDVTNDSIAELFIYLHYDNPVDSFGYSTYAQEVVVFRQPFERKAVHEIFSFFLTKEYSRLLKFEENGNPIYEQKWQNRVNIKSNAKGIYIEGRVNYVDEQELSYTWNEILQEFDPPISKLSSKLPPKRPSNPKANPKTAKHIVQVLSANPSIANSYQIKDSQGRILPLPSEIENYLDICTNISISRNGQYLILRSPKSQYLLFYDFYTQKIKRLVHLPPATESISNIIWSPSQKSIAFEVINQEEFSNNTGVYLIDIKQFTYSRYDIPILYECDQNNCFFPKNNHFLFRNEQVIEVRHFKKDIHSFNTTNHTHISGKLDD